MAEPARQSTISVGDVSVTYLPDGEGRVDPVAFFPGSTPEGWEPHRRWLDDQGRVVATLGGFLIRTGDRNIVVDLGFRHENVEFPGLGSFRGGRLLGSLRAAGLEPGDVDTVLFTHLHLDHVGWTTSGGAGDPSLTFPGARHLVAGGEWDHWHGGEDPLGPSLADVQRPLEDRFESVDDGAAVAPGVNVLATPGHTPGHLSVVVSSGTDRAIILGDVVHCPVQLDEPTWACVADVDPDLAKRTRERLWQELEDPSTVAAGAGHFADFTFGRLMQGQGGRRWTAVGG